MCKVLIAEESELFCDALTALFPETFEVRSIYDGVRLAEQLQVFRPDILVLDIALPGADCIYLLEAARKAGINPFVIALCTYTIPYTEILLNRLQVSLLLRKPCNIKQLAARIMDISVDIGCTQLCIEGWPQAEEVETFLRHLGFFPYLTGYKMLVTAICMLLDNPYLPLTKQLYPRVGDQWGTDWKQAEHAIRNCIAAAYKNRNDWVWQMYFPCGPDRRVKHLKNSVFLSIVVACLRRSRERTAANQ